MDKHEHRHLIDRLLHETGATTALCAGSGLDHPACHAISLQSLATLPADERHELAIVACDLEELEAMSRDGRLAALRDLHAKRLVIIPVGSARARRSDTEALLRAHGFRPLRAGHGIWYHDLYDYKETPDWLNPRFWANPELWDRYRW